MIGKIFGNLAVAAVCAALIYGSFLITDTNIPESFLWIARIILGIVALWKLGKVMMSLVIVAAIIYVIMYFLNTAGG